MKEQQFVSWPVIIDLKHTAMITNPTFEDAGTTTSDCYLFIFSPVHADVQQIFVLVFHITKSTSTCWEISIKCLSQGNNAQYKH